MQQVFANGSNADTRDILIIISDEVIEFFFKEYYDRHNQWLSSQEENGNIEYLDEDEKANNGFYWIDKQHWIKDKTERLDRPDNWHKHMAHKMWFTGEMADFINKATS